MDAQTIADALELRREGNSFRGACPVCGGSDKATKFSMTDAGDRVLVHCFSGCSFTDIAAELRSRGLWPDSTPEQKQEWLQRKREAEAESGKTWLVIAESAVARGDSISRKEQQRLTLLRRLYGGQK